MTNTPRPETLRPYAAGWLPPTKDEIEIVLHLIRERLAYPRPLGGSEVAALVGLSIDPGKGCRAFRRWMSDSTTINYSAWAILCDLAGLGIIWRKDEGDRVSIL